MKNTSNIISFAMIVTTILLVFSPIVKIGTGHLKEALLGGSNVTKSRLMVLLDRLINFLLDE